MNPSDILKYGHRTLHQSLQDLPDSEWEAGDVCGIWSTKDVLSHLTSYEWMLVDVLNSFLGVEDAPVLNQMRTLPPDEFNRSQVEQRRGKTAREVLAELDEAHRRVMALVGQIPPETWRQAGTLPWYGDEYALDDFIVYTFYGHKREHSAQVNAFKDVLKKRG